MKSELVNYLSISESSKILLRSCIELVNLFENADTNNNSISIDLAFQNSNLPFGVAYQAKKELETLNLIEDYVVGKGVKNFVVVLKTKNIVKFIIACIEDHSVNLSDEKINKDYIYICEVLNRIEGYEFKETGSQPVVGVNCQAFDEH